MEGADDAKFEWASSEDDLATVVDGKVVAKQEGTVEITASWNGLVGKYTVEVELKKITNAKCHI